MYPNSSEDFTSFFDFEQQKSDLDSKAEAYINSSKQDELSTEPVPWVIPLTIISILFVSISLFVTLKIRKRKFPRSPSENGFIPWGKSKACNTKPGVMISYSMPDLSSSVSQEQLLNPLDSKKVARQTTLPTVPYRHVTFQRQLSQCLHINNVAVSVHSLQKKRELGSLQPELYLGDIRRTSTASSQVSEIESAGTLSFTMKYDPDIEGLIVKVVQAQNLPVKDVTGSSDPYVKVYLLPDRNKKYSTKVHRRNLSPVFNESFVFSVPWEGLGQRSLQFSVYDFDRFSKNDLIGQVVMKHLHNYVQPLVEIEYAMDILTSKQDARDLGEIMLSLCYLPKAGRLTVTIIKMRNLIALDINGSSDPYVKVALICQGKKIKKKKTTVKKSTLNPVYDESLVFDVPNENVHDITLLIKILDYDRVGSNELLGVVVIGASAIGQGRDHWSDMLKSNRRPVAQWYSLLDCIPGDLISISPTRKNAVPLSCLSAS